MQSSTSNQRNHQKIDEKHVRERLDRAQESFTTSKLGAAKAAAYLWLVLDETRSDIGQQWLQSEIGAEENRRRSANEDLDELKERVAKHANGKLKEEDYRVGENKAGLQSLVSRTKEEWLALRKLPVNPRAGANRYTALARYGLRIESQSDAPLASRYALAVQWVDEQDMHFEDVDEIVAAIGSAGGFEAVVEAQRKKNAGTGSTEGESQDRQLTAAALAKDAVAAIASVTPIASFDFATENAKQGLTRFVARYSEGRADIVAEQPFSDQEVGPVAVDLAPLKTEPVAQFVANVLALGALVVEGKETTQSADGTRSGERLRETRAYCLLPVATKVGETSVADEPNGRILISAVHADAGVAVIATPKEGLDLGVPDVPMFMTRLQVKQLADVLGQPGAAHLVRLWADLTNGLEWVAENSALIEAKRVSGSRRFAWQALTADDPKPLDIRFFQPQFRVRVAMKDVRRLYSERLSAWGDKGASRSKKLVKLAFRDHRVTFEVSGEDDFHIECEQLAENISLQFRGRELYLLTRLLIQQLTDSFQFSGDDAGLLGVAWNDSVGEYKLYQPTATDDGRLQGRCLAPLRLGKADTQHREAVSA